MGAFLIDLLWIYTVIVVIANVTGSYVGYSPLGFKFGLVGDALVVVGEAASPADPAQMVCVTPVERPVHPTGGGRRPGRHGVDEPSRVACGR